MRRSGAPTWKRKPPAAERYSSAPRRRGQHALHRAGHARCAAPPLAAAPRIAVAGAPAKLPRTLSPADRVCAARVWVSRPVGAHAPGRCPCTARGSRPMSLDSRCSRISACFSLGIKVSDDAPERGSLRFPYFAVEGAVGYWYRRPPASTTEPRGSRQRRSRSRFPDPRRPGSRRTRNLPAAAHRRARGCRGGRHGSPAAIPDDDTPAVTVDPHAQTLLKGPRKGVLFEHRPGVTLPAVAHHVSGHYRLPRNFLGDGRFASTARAPDLPSESTCDSIPCRKVSRGLAGACTRFRLAGVHWPQEGPIYRRVLGLRGGSPDGKTRVLEHGIPS